VLELLVVVAFFAERIVAMTESIVERRVTFQIALDSFLDHGPVLDVARTIAFSAEKCSVLRRVLLRVCALNKIYA